MSESVETYRRRGDFIQAEHFNAMVKSRRTELFGTDHPLTLACVYTKGNLFLERGSLDEAESKYKYVIEKRKQVLGIYYSGTLNALSDLGTLYLHKMEYKKAAAMLEEERDQCECLLGPNHYSTFATLNNLASVYVDMGETEAQSEYCCSLLQQGHLEDAARGYRQLLLRQEETLGLKHGALMETLSNMGDALSKLGKEDAEAVLRRGLDISSHYGAGKHEIRWECVERLADYLYRTGANLDEAQDLYQKIIEMKRDSFNIAPLENYATLDSLASLCVDRGKLEEAIEARREMIELSKSFEEDFNEDRAALLADLAWILDRIKRYDEAEPVYRQVLDLLVNTSGDIAERTLQLKAALAWNLENQGRHEEARIFVDQTLEKSRECLVLGPVQLQVAAKAAAVLHRQVERATAIAISQEVLDGSCVVFGDGSDELRAAQINHTVYL
jgi:tetratricopeptide (TPR) repeat protein